MSASKEIIKELLIRLSYETDEKSTRSMYAAFSAARGGALALAAGVTAAASAMVTATAKISGTLDQLHWKSERSGATVASIRSLAYAMSQVGTSYDAALNTIENFTTKLRQNPAYEALAARLGVITRSNGKLRDTGDILKDVARQLRSMPYHVAVRYGDTLGIDEAGLRALMNGDLDRSIDSHAAKLRAMGVDTEKAEKSGVAFMQAWRALNDTLSGIGIRLQQELAGPLAGVVKEIDAFIRAHPEQIVEAMRELGRAAGMVADGMSAIVKAVVPVWTEFDRVSRSITGQGGLMTAFELLAAYITGAWLARVLGGMSAAKGGGSWLLGLGGALALGGSTPQGQNTYEMEQFYKANPDKRPPNIFQRGWNGLKRLFSGASNEGGAIPGQGDGSVNGIRANYMHGQHGGVGENLKQISTPSGKTVTVNADAASAFEGFLKELEASGYKIDDLGGYSPRAKRGGASWSQHAYGNAIDINPSKNPFRTDTTDMPANITEIAKKHGLIWGGNWSAGNRDPMHFEWAGPSTAPARPQWPIPSSQLNATTLGSIAGGAAAFNPFTSPKPLEPAVTISGDRNVKLEAKTDINVIGGGGVPGPVDNKGRGPDAMQRNVQGAVR